MQRCIMKESYCKPWRDAAAVLHAASVANTPVAFWHKDEELALNVANVKREAHGHRIEMSIPGMFVVVITTDETDDALILIYTKDGEE